MNNSLEIQAKELFSKVKVQYIFGILILSCFVIVNILGYTVLIISFFNSSVENQFFEKHEFFILALMYLTAFPVTCWAIFKKMKSNKIKLKYILGRFSLKKRLWLSVFIVILANRILGSGVTQIIVFFTSLVSQDFVKNALESTNELMIYNADNFFFQVIYWLLLFTMTVIVAPITEEFIFRGAILHRWSTKWGIVAGILMSSFVFGLLHLNIFVISISIGGIIYALLYIKTGSLLVPIIAHALNNFLFFVNLFLRDTLSIPSSNEEITILSLWYGIVNISMALPVLIYFLKMPKNIAALPYFANQKRITNSISDRPLITK